jgi:microcystin-dependent protein
MATLTITPIKTFVSGETVTPSKLNELSQSTVALTAGTIVDADVSASAAIALSKLATGALPTAITVASANMVTATAQALLPAGAVMPFAMNSAPAGWLAADGSNVNRTTYAALFSAISTTYGVGDGSTTFTLPDLRGYFVRGSGTNSDATAAGTFGAKQGDSIRGHTHAISFGFVAAKPTASAFTTGGGGIAINGAVAAGSSEIANTVATGDGGAETRPKNIALLYCIKF